MKVIIFYAKYGGGHLSAARSIENCINTYYKNVNVELIDLEAYIGNLKKVLLLT